MKTNLLILTLAACLVAACTGATPETTAPVSISPSLAPTGTPTLSATPAIPTPTPTPVTFPGTVTVRINVRAGPATGQEALGLIEAGQDVQVLGRDETRQWYAIVYPTGPQGRAWIAAPYVQVSDPDGLPVISLATPTPTGNLGRIIQRLNVRTGPATTYEALGLLEPDTIVVVLAKNETGTWLQIAFDGGPEGRGWVTAAYVQIESAADLPVVNPAGTPVTPQPALPTPLSAAASPTVGPAFVDNDSPANPAVRVTFSPSRSRQFTFVSDVSAPDGDLEDWVEFTPSPGAGQVLVYISLTCSGNADLVIEIWQGSSSLEDLEAPACGATDLPLALIGGQSYLLRLQVAEGNGLRYCRYSLTIRNGP
ncbi:MAG: SH3 domain-containing protein [Anaerolineales bacterium]|nr:SH3 domain-containing protein [Anaerolineales bacterium]